MTARTALAVIAASVADPPALRVSMPAADASACGEVTIALGARVAGRPVRISTMPLTRWQGAYPSATLGATRIRAAIVFAGAVASRGDIHSRIFGEETVRLQHEAGVFDGHYRKIFRLAHVCMSERVPHH